MLDHEVYVLTCAGCDKTVTIQAGQPNEIRFCPACDAVLDIEWRPEDHSPSKRGETRPEAAQVAGIGGSSVTAKAHLGVK